MLYYQILEINVLIQAAQFVPFSTCDSVGHGDEASRGKMLLCNMTLSLKWQARHMLSVNISIVHISLWSGSYLGHSCPGRPDRIFLALKLEQRLKSLKIGRCAMI